MTWEVDDPVVVELDKKHLLLLHGPQLKERTSNVINVQYKHLRN